MWEEIGTEYRVSARDEDSETFASEVEANRCAESLKRRGYRAVCIETRKIYKTSIVERLDWK